MIGAAIFDNNVILELLNKIANGMTLGRVINEMNNSAVCKNLGLEFIIFGDPRHKVSIKTNDNDSHYLEPLPYAYDLHIPKSIIFLRAYLTLTLPSLKPNEILHYKVLTDHLQELEYFIFKGRISEFTRQQYHEFSMSVFNFIKERGQTICTDWLELTYASEPLAKQMCPICMSTTSKIKFRLRVDSEYFRIIERCPVCSIIKDISTETDILMSYNGKNVFKWIGKETLTSKCIVLISNNNAKHNKILQPLMEESGVSISLKQDLDIFGPLRVSLLLYSNYDIGIYTIACHSDQILATV